ncbi:hypothetical protein VP1G_07935 [Cytospora mali]|uniref:Uncharacterized protein n=1 Tax=Cytospora mali TaxID=578113 RepID=A0A194VA66_CYTMA|nr:hypothetical protein VP1G_07935 [Valsa mali var. pyri (nom. inval.)]
MHAFSIVSLLVSGLAASTVAGLDFGAHGTAMARSGVALIAVAVAPVLAAPVNVAVEPRHHQGKGGKKKNTGRQEEGDIEAREPHHQGRGGKNKNNGRQEEVDLEAREPHHQGRGGKNKNNGRQEEVDLEAREPHHQGRGGKNKNNGRQEEVDLEAREPHPVTDVWNSIDQGRGGKNKNNGRQEEVDLEAREPHLTTSDIGDVIDQGKTAAKACKRSVDEDTEHLEARHHQGKTASNAKEASAATCD